MDHLRPFFSSLAVTAIALVIAFVYDGVDGVLLALILGVLEVSLSFDNAVINASVLERMSAWWQRIFLTLGMVIAVFGMRLLFPLLVVWMASGLGPRRALDLALHPPAGGAEYFPDGQASYETILRDAHPQIAAFGGMFLLLLFLTFILRRHEHRWLPVEGPLQRLGRLPGMNVIVAAVVLGVVALWVAPRDERATVLVAGVFGMVVYLVVGWLGSAFEPPAPDSLAADDDDGVGATDRAPASGATSAGQVALATGRAALFMFIYLEVLDASFSLDGVIGAFAITPDPIIIALGLGAIGAMFVRSITVYLVRHGTLSEYRFVEHGAHWAIGALAAILLLSITHEVSDVITGLIGVAFIGAAVWSSVRANRRDAAIA